MKHGNAAAWAMIVRTAVFDEMIMTSIAERGVDMVINLAAGLDTRPWRLALPPTLRWADVDLPAILQYKTETLTHEWPQCRYEAVPADLTDARVRSSVLARLGTQGKRILVLTEGLLIYLTAEQVGELAGDLAHQPTIQWWLTDLANPTLLKWMLRSWGKAVEKGNAPFQFAPEQGPDFFLPFGWKLVEFRSSMLEARRLKREMRLAWVWRIVSRCMSAKRREEMRRRSGIVLFERQPVAGSR
jgi:methyltransferase (TIGR00027 family)